MAYGFNANHTMPPAGVVPQNQTVQPLFPQPQGNVYQINSTLEVANVPVGAGMSIALCLPENVMYIKTMQNGNPLFYPYKIEPLTGNEEPHPAPAQSEDNNVIDQLIAQLNSYDERISALEQAKPKPKGGFDL